MTKFQTLEAIRNSFVFILKLIDSTDLSNIDIIIHKIKL